MNERRAMRFLLIIIILLPLLSRAIAGDPSPEEQYLRRTGDGDCLSALAALREWTAATKDPVVAEINLFRIRELSEDDDLAAPALETLQALDIAPVFQDPFLRDRLELFTAALHLRAGNIGEAASLISRAGYLDLVAAGPFHTVGPERTGISPFADESSPGLFPRYAANPDRTGAVRIAELMPVKHDSFCCFYRSFAAPVAGHYYIILGTTGPSELWLDGKKIFSRETGHNFDHDQYFIHVRLTPGAHRIMIKAGDFEGRISVSLRIVESEGGRPLPAAIPGPGTPAGRSELVGIAYFPALAALVKIRDPDTETRFHAGYLLHRARLGGRYSHPARAFLESIETDDFRRSAARRYLARMSAHAVAKERHLREALAADPKSAVTRHSLARLAASRGFVHEAWALAGGIVTAPHLRADAMIRIFRTNGWTPAALQAARELGKSSFPARGLDLEAAMRIAGDDWHGAITPLERLLQLDRFRPSRYFRLATCYEKIGSTEHSERLLARAVAVFPNSTAFRLRLAAVAESRSGSGAALPHLAAALKRAPHNGRVMEALGGVYERIKRKNLALHWLGRALEAEPGNHDLRDRLARLRGDTGALERLRLNLSLAALAASYRDEPAVTLLDETLISVNVDASFERWVRRVVMINTILGAGTFPAPRIAMDPGMEIVGESSLTLVRKGVPVPIARRVRESVGQGELLVIEHDLPALAPGDILDLEYRTKSRGNRGSPGSYSARVAPGSEYRTMVFRAALIHPGKLPIYCHTKGMGTGVHSMTQRGSSTCHLVMARDLMPPAREVMMPPLPQIAPWVYFTTFKTWDDFFSQSSPDLEKRLMLDDDMTRILDSMGALGGPPMDRVHAVFSHVAGRIRIIEEAPGAGPSLPGAADTTYHTGRGTAQDASFLLVAMLRKAGIDARPALVRRHCPLPPHPYPGDFDHLLCHVNLDGGFFLDPSRGTHTLPAESRGIPALVVEGSRWRIVTTGGAPLPGPSLESNLAVTVSPEGDADMALSLVDRWGMGPIPREDMRFPSRRLNRLNEVWNTAYPGSSVTGVTVSRFDGNLPVEYACKVSVPGFADPGKVPLSLDAFPLKSSYGRRYAPTKSRTHPLLLSGPWTARSTVTFTVPSGYRVDRLPRGARFHHDFFSAEFSYEASAGTIRVRSIIEVKRSGIPPVDYPRFREFTRFIDRKERDLIILDIPQR